MSHSGVEPEAAVPDSPAGDTDPLIASLDALVEDATVDRSQFYSSAAAATLEAAFRSRYRVLGTLGQGSMGQVFDAEDVRLHRRVAIKVIAARDATTAAFTRRESEVLAALRHPGIVTVYDCGELADGRPYFVMEQVPGENLLDYCRTHQLGLRDKLELMRLIARSVGMAHLLTIVHRDLKPQNIRVRPDGKPTILDFGIAKFETLDLPASAGDQSSRPHEGDREPTARTPYETVVRGGIKGTLRYMSPEQAAGELVDSRADVYALGLILYELLTGTLPHNEPASDITPARWAARLRAQPPRNVRQLAPQIPADVAAIVERCLAQRAADRYATAGQLADDLDAYLAGEPVAAVSRHRALYRLQKFTRRHWISTSLGLTAASILAAVIALAFTRVREERNLARDHAARAEASLRTAAVERRRAEEHLAVAQREERRARERELATERHLYTEHMGQAKRLIDSGNLFQAIELLDQYAPLDKYAASAGATPRRDLAIAQTDHRGFEWHYLKKLCERDHRQLTGHAAAINCLRYSRDGNCLASGDDAGAVRIWRPNGNAEPIALDAHRHAVVDLAFSGNGQVLATIGDDRRCRVWEVSSGRPLAELRTNNNPLVSAQLTSVALSSDGSHCATGDSQGEVMLWQVAAGEGRRVEDAQSRPGPCYVAFSSDDATLLVGGKGQNARAFDVTSGQRIAQSPTLAGPVTRVCAADTPDVFAAGDLFGCVYLFKRDGDKLVCQAPLTILSGRVRDLSFSVDGQAVVAVAESGAAVAIDINDGRTRSKLEAIERSARAIAAHVGAQRPSIAWSTPDHSVDVYAFPKPREYERIATADSPNWLDLSADDRTLAVAFGNKSYVDLIDAAAERESEPTPQQSLEQSPEPTSRPPNEQSTRRFSDHRGPLSSVSFSRDGRLLLAADGLGFVAVRDLSNAAADAKPLTHEFGWANSVAAVFAGPQNAVYAGGLEGKLRVWMPGSSKVTTLQGGHGPLPVLCVAATRDGRRVASGCFDGSLAIWDTSDQKLLTKVSAHRHQINQIAIDPASAIVATTSLDSTVRLWSMADGRELATLPCERPSWGVAFSADGRTLATSHDLGEPNTSYLQLWNVATRRELFRLPAPEVRRWTALRFSSEGRRLYATGGNGDSAGIYFWSTGASPSPTETTQHADAERNSGQATP